MRLFSIRSLTLALAATLATTAVGCTLTAQGHLRGPGLIVMEAPPPPPPQPTIEVRAGFLWVDGYQRWDNGRYVWQEGRYERQRAGYVYAPSRWQRQGRGHVFVQGGWKANGANRGQRRDHRKH